MKKAIKSLGVLLAVGSVFILGACGDTAEEIKNEKNEAVIKSGEDTYSELNMLTDIHALGGDSILLQAILGKVLLYTYDVDEEEIKEKEASYIEDFGGEEAYKEELSDIGLTEEDITKHLTIEVAQDKAMKEMNGVTEEKIKEEYDRVKDALEISMFMTMDEEVADKVKDKLEKGEEVEKINEGLDPSEQVNEDLLIKGQVDEVFDEVFKLKEGEIHVFEKEGIINVIRNDGELERTYEELSGEIEEGLMFEGIETTLDIIEFVIGKDKVELQGSYKELIDGLIEKKAEEGK